MFVRDLSQQVRYVKLMTIYGLQLLLVEMAWAVAMAGATGGASMAWLAARMAVMRMLLSRWWGQLFMRLAMAAAGGVGFNVLPDLQAQLQMLGENSSDKWDGKLSGQAAGTGAFSALVSLPLSAVGGLVSNALMKVLVRGLGDEVDEAILEAAVKRAVAEHAELYPVSAMARFADVVGEHLDVYAGMTVRGMWWARFGHGVGEALENALSELLGEVAYQAAMGLPVTWNLYALSAGGSESVAGGVGNLAGLALRGKLHPDGPSPYLDDTSRREGATTEGGGFDEEKTPLLGIGSGSQTGNSPGSPDKTDASTPSDASDASDRPGTPPPAYSDATPDFGSARPVPPPRYGPVAGGDQVVAGVYGVSGVDVSGVSGNRMLDVLASQTQDSTGERSTAGIPHVSGVSSDAALRDTVIPGSGSGRVADLNGEAVSPGRESSVDDRTGQGGSSGVDSVAGGGDWHRGGEVAVSPDSATLPAAGPQAVPLPSPRQDPVTAPLAGLPVNTVRVPVPADVVAGGGLVEFVRGGVTDSTGGPVLLVSPGNSDAGVVVSPAQGWALAREVGRDVVAMTPGQGGRGPQRTVFAADGSAPRPVAGPGAPVPAGAPGSPAAAPAGTAASGRPPVRQGSRPDVRREIDRARKPEGSGDDEPAVQRIVQDTRDIPGLARGDAAVSLEERPALVAAEHHELGRDHQDQVVEFPQAPADSLDTQGTGPGIHAGAGPQPGRDMLSQSADDPGSDTGESRGRYVVHGDPGRKADHTAQPGHDFSPAAHDPHDTLDRAHQDLPSDARFGADDVGLTAPPQFPHTEGPTRAEIWIQPVPLPRDPAEPAVSPNGHRRTREDLRRDPVKPVPETIQEQRRKREGTRRRLSWPDGRRAEETASTATDSSNTTSQASREACEVPSVPAPIRPQEDTRAVTGGDDSGFLGGYSDDYAVGSLGLSDGKSFGELFPEDAVSPDAVWSGAVGVAVGFGYRFVRGVNQANYFSGDERFRVNCLEACVAFHNSVKFGRQFVAGPAGDRDPAALEVAFGRQAWWVEGVAGAQWYVRSGPVGVAVPVIYQRADGSAHVINAVHTDSKDHDGHDVVVLWDPQRGEEAEKADVSAVSGMWVIPVLEAEPDREIMLPPGGSQLRGQGWGSALPTEVTGPKRQPGASGPVAGKTGPKGTKRTRGQADESARGEAGESSGGAKRRKVAAVAAGIDPGSPGNGESEVLTPTDQATQQDERSTRRKQQNRARSAKYYQARKAEAARVAELEELQGRGQLTEEQEAELAALQPKVAQQKQQVKAKSAKDYQAVKAEAARVAELEELQGRGQLTEGQEAELAALRLKVAQQKQQKRERDAKQYQAVKAAAARVAELEELQGRGQLTEGQEAELVALRPKAERKQQKRERDAKQYQAVKAAADRVAELEELEGRGQLTEAQAVELAALQPKAARKQQKKEKNAKRNQAVKAAADRVVVLEELEGRGQLTEGQAVELVALRPKAERKQQQKAYSAKHYQAVKAAADRVAELEKLAGRGQLTEGQAVELAALQPKVAQRKQQKRERDAKSRQAVKAAADRVVVLEELEGRGQLTEEQAAELAALRLKVAGRKKTDREVMETGVSGAAVAGRDERSAGPEGVSEWTGADQGDRDAWLADFDLGAWLDQAVADSAVSRDAGAGGAGVMLGEGAFGDVVATELTAFLGQDARDDTDAGGAGAVAGGDDFAGFLGGYHDWAGPVGLFGVDRSDGGSFGEPFPVDAVWPDAVWPDVVWPDAVGVAVGFGYRFVRGVNQANYFSGDERFRVNCLEACVAFHNSVKFGRQFVAGPAGDRDPAALEVAFGRQAWWVGGVAGAQWYVRSGPVGVAVPVIYQRADGSAHVINAVHTDSKDHGGHDVVVLWDPQRGEEAEKADVSAVSGMWVIPVPEAEPDREIMLPPGGSQLRGQGWGSALPTEVTGPKRQPGVSGPVAGKTGPKGTKRTRGQADESAREAKRRKVGAAAAGIDPGSPGNGESEVLTPTDQATQQDERSAQRKQQNRANSAKYRQGLKAAAARVAELEKLQGRGQLTEGQEAELAALQPKAERKQQNRANSAKYRQGLKAAAARVAELEKLQGRGQLTEGQEAELAALQPKEERKQQQKAKSAKQYQAVKAAAARVAVLEELEGRGQLTEGQEAELAALQPKAAARKQQEKANSAKYRQAVKAAADRVAELEELEGRGQLTEGQAAELAALRPKVAQQKQKKKAKNAKDYQAIKAAADRVGVLEELAGRGQLTEGQAAELAALRPKVAQQKQQKRERDAKSRQGRKAEAARVAELEELEGRGQLTEELAAELGALRLKVVGWGRKKKDREVMETGVSGVGGDAVAGRVEWSAGPEGVSGWTGADQGDRDGWLADFDLGAWLDQAVADSAVSRDAGAAANSGVMLGEGAFGDVVATELTAFLGQDARDDTGAGDAGAVAGGDDFAGFLPDYHNWEGPVGLSGVDRSDGLPFGEPFPVDAVWPDAVWPDAVWPDAVGFGYGFVRGVNQANYFSGDERFRVNCLEACVAFHNSLKFGRQFVAGPAGDRDPAALEVAFGRQAWWVGGVAGAQWYVRSGPVGVAVPVIYQRADGSAHVINAVHTDSKDHGGNDVVVLWDPQRGEEAEKADVSAVSGMWVIPVPEAEPDREIMLPPGGSPLRSQGWGSALPTEVTGPKRQPGVSGPVAGKTGPKGGKRTRGKADESSEGEAGQSARGPSGGRWQQPLLGLIPGVRAMARVRYSPRPIRQHNRTSGVRSGNSKRRQRTRSSTRR